MSKNYKTNDGTSAKSTPTEIIYPEILLLVDYDTFKSVIKFSKNIKIIKQLNIYFKLQILWIRYFRDSGISSCILARSGFTLQTINGSSNKHKSRVNNNSDGN